MTTAKKRFAAWLTAAMVAAAMLTGGSVYLAGKAAAEAGEPSYQSKLIVRYSLDEVKSVTEGETTTKYFEGVDKDGAPLNKLRATRGGGAQLTASMEGAGAADFSGSNMVVPAFLGSEDTGFSVSTWMVNNRKNGDLNSDWNVLAKVGQLEIGLPNVTVLNPGDYVSNPSTTYANHWPTEEQKFNGGQWDSFINVNEANPVTANRLNDYFYLTVTFDENGITYYKDGVKLIAYGAAETLGGGGAQGITFKQLVDTIISQVKTGAMTLAPTAIKAMDDVRLSKPLTEEEVAAQYAACSGLTVSGIATKTGEVVKEFDYDDAICGIPVESVDYKVDYLVDATSGGNPDANMPEIVIQAAKFVTRTEKVDGVDTVVKELSNLTEAEYSVQVVHTTEAVKDEAAKTTTVVKTYRVTAGSGATKDVKIRFVRSDDLDVAKQQLSSLRVDGVLVEGFASSVTEYVYRLAPDTDAIPEVTYTAMLPDMVVVEDNRNEAFNGVQFLYTIEIYAKGTDGNKTGEAINAYTVTFNRTDSAVGTTLTVNGNGMANFNPNLYYTPAGSGTEESGVQNIYVNAAIADNSLVSLGLAYPDYAEVSSVNVSGDRITIIVADTVSERTKTYIVKQIVYDEESDLLYDTELNSGTLSADKDGNIVSADGLVSLHGAAKAEASCVDIGADGYIDIGDFLSGQTPNRDGLTLLTWMKMPQPAAIEWAGVMTVTVNGRQVILNNNQVLTGSYDSSWTNDGTAAGSERFKSDTYKLAALVLTDQKVTLYVDGALIVSKSASLVKDFTKITSVGLGRSHMNTETLGSGYFKNFMVYNAPLSQDSIASIYTSMNDALLTKIEVGGTALAGFSPKKFDYDIEVVSDKMNPTAADFPAVTAANGAGAIAAGKITAGTVAEKSLTFTIVSEANGFTNTYTVTVTLVNNDSTSRGFNIRYDGEVKDIDDDISASDFVENASGVYEYTYKVWTGCDISQIIVTCAIDESAGQSIEGESTNANTKKYSVTVYASDGSSTKYVINFVEDASVANPDEEENAVTPSPEPAAGCGCGTIGFGTGAGIMGGGLILLAMGGVMLAKRRIMKKSR